ncbi:hypothetical protein [Bradyrhizobium sp. CCGE-LA001]|uniref:hypothetical protein n=1 Tax=Bradyrhizobium sp. CCGE-LA001 TaxID=1223566 RepID=UPI001313EF87|nr:hypothetical protein [Bradyrhizobium sp. CCGE-LA001]
MAKRDYIADSALLPHPSLAFQARSNLTDFGCSSTGNPVATTTDPTALITQLFNG